MSRNPIRLGIIGANVERGWALDAHLPALQRQSRFVVSAVSARSQALADAAARHFGAARGYGNSLALVRDPDVDMVVVTVRVPEHRTVVLAALAAGKHVYCEWPLGRDVAEAAEMTAAVSPGQFAIIGAQGLCAPAVQQAAQLISDGAIGRPLLLRAYNSAAPWGPVITNSYLQDKNSGATLATIGMGHILPVIDALVGAYAQIDARCSILWPRVQIGDTGDTMERTLEDHILAIGSHAAGCISTLETIGGTTSRTASIEIIGETGSLTIRGQTPGTFQIARLALEGSIALPAPRDPVAPDLVGPSANLAEVYARLAQDFDNGVQTLPSFADALRLTRVIDAIDTASHSGNRQQL